MGENLVLAEVHLGVTSTTYSQALHQSDHGNFQVLDFRLRDDWDLGVWRADLNAGASLSLEADGFTIIDAPEASVSRALSEEVRIGFGRRIQKWNALDESWELGIWQPRFRWDYLNPEAVGLLGTFLDYQKGTFRLTAFASPGFIPERGTPVNFDGGKLSSPSPWFLNPPSHVEILGRNTAVNYELGEVDVLRILAHPGAALRASILEEESHGFNAAIGYAYKPVNQLLIAYEGFLDTSTRQVNAAAVLHPQVAYHHLLSVDAGYSFAGGSRGARSERELAGNDSGGIMISFLAEAPVQSDAPDSWETQRLTSAWAVSPKISFGSFSMSYLRQWGGDDPSGSFEPRFPFSNAAKLQWSPSWLGGRLMANSSLTRDLERGGAILSSDVIFRAGPRWSLSAGLDVLGSNSPEGFIGRYRSHDRVRGGVSYVF